jgi:hypothetical protein
MIACRVVSKEAQTKSVFAGCRTVALAGVASSFGEYRKDVCPEAEFRDRIVVETETETVTSLLPKRMASCVAPSAFGWIIPPFASYVAIPESLTAISAC